MGACGSKNAHEEASVGEPPLPNKKASMQREQRQGSDSSTMSYKESEESKQVSESRNFVAQERADARGRGRGGARQLPGSGSLWAGLALRWAGIPGRCRLVAHAWGVANMTVSHTS